MEHLYNEFEWPFEISGFGGGYEQACRNMAKAGVEWLRAHPEELAKWRKARDEFHKEFGEDKHFPPHRQLPTEKEFEDAIVKVCNDCTGAMFCESMSHAIAIFEMGWSAYVDKVMSARAKN